MLEFQQRVVTEKTELDVKLAALAKFLTSPVFTGLPVDEQKRLNHQHKVMDEYSRILRERIAAFAPECIQSFDCNAGDHSDACPCETSNPRCRRLPCNALFAGAS